LKSLNDHKENSQPFETLPTQNPDHNQTTGHNGKNKITMQKILHNLNVAAQNPDQNETIDHNVNNILWACSYILTMTTASRCLFCDESTFCLSSVANRHNCKLEVLRIHMWFASVNMTAPS
jgi:hypothetical protein